MATHIHIHLAARKTKDADYPVAGVLLQDKGSHKKGEKITVLEFKGSGMYRVRFENGETDVVGASSFSKTSDRQAKDKSILEDYHNWCRQMGQDPKNAKSLQKFLGKAGLSSSEGASLAQAAGVQDSAGAVAKVEREIAQHRKLIDAMEKSGKDSGPLKQKLKFLQEELQKAKATEDAYRESLSSNDIAEKYGFAFAQKLDREGKATAPDGKKYEKDGRRFVCTNDAAALEVGKKYRSSKGIVTYLGPDKEGRHGDILAKNASGFILRMSEGDLSARVGDASKEELEKQLEAISAEIEALEDKGVAIPSAKLAERKRIQEALKNLG